MTYCLDGKVISQSPSEQIFSPISSTFVATNPEICDK